MQQLLSKEQIEAGVAALARSIQHDFADRRLTVVGVLTGSIIFLSDVIRQIDLPLRVGLVSARSYRGAATRPGSLSVQTEHLSDVTGRDVLLLDDIFDTGQTLSRLIGLVRELQPASLSTAVLLRKAGRAEVELKPDYVAFEIPDCFVVGYGLDYQDAYRNLPHIAALEDHEVTGGA